MFMFYVAKTDAAEGKNSSTAANRVCLQSKGKRTNKKTQHAVTVA